LNPTYIGEWVMNQIDLFRTLQQDEHVLNIAAAAMYKIREPKGSTRLSFEQLSPHKQARNRELAVQILRTVLERYPDPTKVSSPDEVKVFLAEQMYKMLAPKKSESFPFDQRTPFARSYYQERAETFLRNFLLPLAEQTQRQSTARPIDPGKSDALSPAKSKPKASSLPPTKSTQSLPPSKPLRSPTDKRTSKSAGPVGGFPLPGTQPLAIDTTGADKEERTSSKKHSDPHRVPRLRRLHQTVQDYRR
jgi:hypothetical protein